MFNIFSFIIIQFQDLLTLFLLIVLIILVIVIFFPLFFRFSKSFYFGYRDGFQAKLTGGNFCSNCKNKTYDSCDADKNKKSEKDLKNCNSEKTSKSYIYGFIKGYNETIKPRR